jgi:hypothetical protein
VEKTFGCKRLLAVIFIMTQSFSLNAQKNEGNLHPLTSNLYVNITEKYPNGYEPKWRLVGSPQQLQLKSEVYIAKNTKTNTKTIPFGIVEYQGKTVVRMRALDACECVADIRLLKSKTVLTEYPDEFELVNFRKVQLKSLDDPNAECKNMSSNTWGGWKGNIILSSDNEGNIKFDIKLENYNNKGNLSWLLYGNDIEMANLVTPGEAKNNQIVDIKAKKDAEYESKKREEDAKKREYLDRMYSLVLKDIQNRPASKPKTKGIYKGYELKEMIWISNLLSKSEIENFKKFEYNDKSKIEKPSINSELEKKINEQMNASYSQSLKMDITFMLIYAYNVGLFGAWNPKEYAPHERDLRFTQKYVMTNYYNKKMIEYATYIKIGDTDKMHNLVFDELDIHLSKALEGSEPERILEYLQKKN